MSLTAPFGIVGGIGVGELLIVLAIVLLFFGASRIPALGRAFGRGIRAARDAIGAREGRAEEERAEIEAPPAPERDERSSNRPDR
jgi:sec-independent protein translocase protein TatA